MTEERIKGKRGRKPKRIPMPDLPETPKEPEEGRDQNNGRFLPGNKLWHTRSSCGANPTFQTPDDLWFACKEYFQWYEDNPLFEAKAFAYEGEITIAQIPKLRAMSITSLCIFLDITQTTWGKYRKNPDFVEAITRVESIIYSQKFEGASAGLLNPSIITRDLGLVDKVESNGTTRYEVVNSPDAGDDDDIEADRIPDPEDD